MTAYLIVPSMPNGSLIVPTGVYAAGCDDPTAIDCNPDLPGEQHSDVPTPQGETKVLVRRPFRITPRPGQHGRFALRCILMINIAAQRALALTGAAALEAYIVWTAEVLHLTSSGNRTRWAVCLQALWQTFECSPGPLIVRDVVELAAGRGPAWLRVPSSSDKRVRHFLRAAFAGMPVWDVADHFNATALEWQCEERPRGSEFGFLAPLSLAVNGGMVAPRHPTVCLGWPLPLDVDRRTCARFVSGARFRLPVDWAPVKRGARDSRPEWLCDEADVAAVIVCCDIADKTLKTVASMWHATERANFLEQLELYLTLCGREDVSDIVTVAPARLPSARLSHPDPTHQV